MEKWSGPLERGKPDLNNHQSTDRPLIIIQQATALESVAAATCTIPFPDYGEATTCTCSLLLESRLINKTSINITSIMTSSHSMIRWLH